MIIKRLQINDKQAIFGQHTLLHSEKNSSGKTTFIRLLLFALGFAIPSTKGLDFSKVKTQIEIDVDQRLFLIIREKDHVTVYMNDQISGEYNVKYERQELLSHITGVTNVALLDSLLATFYFDQEKGWTMLNRGDAIGKIHFSVERFVQGLLEIDKTDLEGQLLNIDNDLRGYKLLEENLQFKNEIEKNQDNIDWMLVDELNDDLRSIMLNKNVVKNDIANLSEAKRNNKKLVEMIDSFGLKINYSGELFYLRKDQIVGFNENEGLLNARITMLNRKLNSILKEEDNIKKRLESQTALFDVTTQLNRFKNSVSNLSIDGTTITEIIKSLKKSRTDIKSQLESLLRDNAEANKLYKLILDYTQFLGVSTYIDQTKDFVFTKNLKAYSGAVLHLLVFSFRLSFLKLMQEKTGLILPVIIDSPFGKEVTKENVMLMYRLIKKEFPENQIITASIENIDEFTDIDKKYFFSGTMFESLDDIK